MYSPPTCHAHTHHVQPAARSWIRQAMRVAVSHWPFPSDGRLCYWLTAALGWAGMHTAQWSPPSNAVHGDEQVCRRPLAIRPLADGPSAPQCHSHHQLPTPQRNGRAHAHGDAAPCRHLCVQTRSDREYNPGILPANPPSTSIHLASGTSLEHGTSWRCTMLDGVPVLACAFSLIAIL